MDYYYSTILNNITFEEAIEKVTAELQKEGFGVLTEIDIKATLKKKLDVDFYNYRILGACNAPFAYKALKAEDKIGTMLPCNVIVQEKEPGIFAHARHVLLPVAEHLLQMRQNGRRQQAHLQQHMHREQFWRSGMERLWRGAGEAKQVRQDRQKSVLSNRYGDKKVRGLRHRRQRFCGNLTLQAATR